VLVRAERLRVAVAQVERIQVVAVRAEQLQVWRLQVWTAEDCCVSDGDLAQGARANKEEKHSNRG
jgi:hypothetical protein